MKLYKNSVAVLLFALTTTVFADSGYGVCREIQWQPYQTYTIKAALHRRVHIILPEPIQGTPVPGSPQLWDVDGENIHLFIKPKNLGNKEGGITSVTVVSTTNTSFDFKVIRVKSNPDTCVHIVREGSLSASNRQGWATPEQRLSQGLQAQLSALRLQLAQSKQDKNLAVEDSLMAYRSNIYTGYEWQKSGVFFGKNTVSDVWDDGRFTYVRLTNPNKGILTVTALVNGKEEMADYKYDPSAKIYMITGLFPSFLLRYDEAEIKITRKERKS